MNISVTKTTNPKPDPDWKNLAFGVNFTDHMFIMNYQDSKGWFEPRIVPYAPFELDPATMVFHYAQEAFEGLKAYRADNGDTLLFRPEMNISRMNASLDRMCIPEIDPGLYMEAIKTLVRTDIRWVPSEPGTSLYIRPFVIATDAHLGVRASHSYIFAIILSPVGAYYAEGLDPVKIHVENVDVRAVKGGTGMAKVGGNYAATIRAQVRAHEKGFSQVLWLDGVHREYIEEVGSMNVFFKIGGEIVTPALEGSILPGITRNSCIELVKSWGIAVSERRITIAELVEAADSGKLEEAFGSGTAAVISPIGELSYGGKRHVINGGRIGGVSQKLYDELTGIQWGKIPDGFGWTVRL